MPRKRPTAAQQAPPPADFDLDLLALRVQPMSVDQLQLDPKNARKHNTRNIHAIADSLRQFGQRKPLVVRSSTMVVEAGNGTLMAARMLGAKRVAAILCDDDEASAIAYAIADNRTGELAQWDWPQLSDHLRELAEQEVDLGELGWRNYEIEPLLSATWTPPVPAPKPDVEHPWPALPRVGSWLRYDGKAHMVRAIVDLELDEPWLVLAVWNKRQKRWDYRCKHWSWYAEREDEGRDTSEWSAKDEPEGPWNKAKR